MVIALLILVGGMVSVLALFSTSVSIHRSAVDDATAALLAEEALDRIRVVWDAEGDLARVRELDLTGATSGPYRVEAEVAPVESATDALAVTIRVAWTRGTGTRSASFESVLLRDAFDANVRAARSSSDRTRASAPPGAEGD